MNPNQALAQLKSSMETHALSGWSACLDHAVKRFGVCNFTKKQISLSRSLCELNSDEEVTDTILHEIAHALAYERHGENCAHDKRWKEICIEIGARPEACFDDSIVTPEAPWLLVHKTTNEVFHSYHKKPRRKWSQMWIRGRKEETLGQLVIKSRQQVQSETKDTEKDSSKNTAPEPIQSFTPQTVLQVQEDLVAIIKTYARQHGLETGATKCRYNAQTCDFTIALATPSTVDVEKLQRIEFEALAPGFDLTAEDYQRPFNLNGKRFRLVALKPNNRKYPIIGADDSDQQYKFTLDVIKQFDNAF